MPETDCEIAATMEKATTPTTTAMKIRMTGEMREVMRLMRLSSSLS